MISVPFRQGKGYECEYELPRTKSYSISDCPAHPSFSPRGVFSALRKLYHGALSVLIIVAFPAVRYSLFVCVSICLYFPLLTAARLVKHAVAMPQIRTGLPLPSGRGISLGLFNTAPLELVCIFFQKINRFKIG